MGQQLPNFQNGPLPAAFLNGQPPQPTGIVPNAPAMGIPGVDPRMMAQAQQQIADPNGGDAVSILPGPKEFGLGAAAGVGTALGLRVLAGNPEKGEGAISWLATKLDRFHGIRDLSDWLNGKFKNASAKNRGYREYLLSTALDKGKAEQAIAEMEKNQLTSILEQFEKRFDSEKAWFGKRAGNKEKAKKLEQAYSKLHAEMGNPKAINLLPGQWSQYPNQRFGDVMSDLEAKIEFLAKKTNKSPEEKRLSKLLFNLKERISGVNGHYKPIVASQARIASALAEKNVGPVGRSIALGMNYLQRIFNGDTLFKKTDEEARKKAIDALNGKQGLKKAMGLIKNHVGAMTEKAMPFLGPVLAGGIIFGQSLDKAKKSKQGEKKQAFFQDFIGSGIGSFVGWEVGRKLLVSARIPERVFGKAASNTLPRIAGRSIPLLGAITLGGLATEVVAMFGFGFVFQKAGEKISHVIFGKPSEVDPNGKAKPAASNPYKAAGMPNGAYPAMAQSPGFQPAPGAMAAPGTNTAQPQASAPQFSINPAEIAQSKAGNSMQSLQNQIIQNMSQPKGGQNQNTFLP